MALTNISAVTDFTVKGNDDKTNALASIAEVQVKKILVNNQALLGIRASAIAQSISNFNGLGTGIYRVIERNVFGTDYDFYEGIKAQETTTKHTTLNMDQHLTISIPFESLDMDRFMESPIQVRASLVNGWIESAVQSYLLSIEAIFLRGVIDFTIAMGNKRPENLIKLNIDDIKDEKSARELFTIIRNQSTRLSKLFTKSALGVDRSALKLAISYELYDKLVTWLPGFNVSEIVSNTLATGNLYKDEIMGIPFRQHVMLNSKYDKNSNAKINKDLSFDFTGIHFLFYIEDAIAQPMGTEITQMVFNYKTLNYEYKSKNLGSLPEVLRGEYVLIGAEESAITPTIITNKQSLKYDAAYRSYEKSYQLPTWDNDFGTGSTTLKETK